MIFDTDSTKRYKTQRGIECLNSCIFNYLYYDGILINKSDIFFWGEGFKLYYIGRFENRMIYSKQYESNFRFLSSVMPNSILKNVLSDSLEDLKKFLIQKVEEEERIIIRVSSSWLPYNRTFSKSEIISHYINVIGYDYEKKAFWVSDGCPPVLEKTIFEGWMEEEELLSNWDCMNGEYLILKYEPNQMISVMTTLGKKMSDKVIRQLKMYVGAAEKIRLFGSEQKKYKGCQSVLTLLNDMQALFENTLLSLGIRQTCELEQKDKVRKAVIETNKQLKINGFIQSKEFLREYLQVNDISENVISDYQAVVNQWNKLFAIMLKAGIKCDKEVIGQVIKKAELLTQQEKVIISEIIFLLKRAGAKKKTGG